MNKLLTAVLIWVCLVAANAPQKNAWAEPATDSRWYGNNTSFVLSTDGKLLVTCHRKTNDAALDKNADWDVDFHEMPAGKLMRTLTLNNARHLLLALSPDGKTLAVGFDMERSYGETELYDVDTLRELDGLDRFPRQKDKIGPPFGCRYSATIGVTYSPDGKLLASLHLNGDINIEEVSGHLSKQLLKGKPGAITFSVDGKTLANVANDGELRVFVVM